MALDKDYVKVDVHKILDAADQLDTIIKEMEQDLEVLKLRVKLLEGKPYWRGAAYDRWRSYYDKRYAKVVADVEKYKQFSKYLRDRAQVYLLYAAEAQALADNLDSEVTKLVSSLLVQSGASLREVQDAAKRRREGEGN